MIEKTNWELVRCRIKMQVWEQVQAQLSDHIPYYLYNEVWGQVEGPVWSQIENQGVNPIKDQIGDQNAELIRDKLKDSKSHRQIRDIVWYLTHQLKVHVGYQVWEQVEVDVCKTVEDQVWEPWSPVWDLLYNETD